MRKKILVAVLTFALLGLTVVPALGEAGINFTVRDSVTGDPWGTVAGQQYHITVTDATNGVALLDTGVITSPPALAFSCDFGSACPPGSGTSLSTPPGDALLIVEIQLTGTADPDLTPNLSQVYWYDSTDEQTYLQFDQLTGTGPTAITLQQVDAGNANNALPLAGLALLLLLTATFVVLRRKATA